MQDDLCCRVSTSAVEKLDQWQLPRLLSSVQEAVDELYTFRDNYYVKNPSASEEKRNEDVEVKLKRILQLLEACEGEYVLIPVQLGTLSKRVTSFRWGSLRFVSWQQHKTAISIMAGLSLCKCVYHVSAKLLGYNTWHVLAVTSLCFGKSPKHDSKEKPDLSWFFLANLCVWVNVKQPKAIVY